MNHHTTHPPPRTWHLLGTGAMACLWACALSRGGHAARLIGRVPAASAACHVITLLTAEGVERHEVQREGVLERGPIERLLVCTKACDAEAAVREQAARLAPGAAVVLLQNGIGFQQSICDSLPEARVFAALTTEGAFLEAPFCVRHAGRGHTVLGRFPRGGPEQASALAAELGGGGLSVEPVGDVASHLWRKLAVNCAINPLTALHRCRNGALLDDPALVAEFAALCDELERAFAALGHAEVAATLREQATRVARATAANRSSMLQDLEAGRPTEIEFITGYLCRAARAAGIACPRNDALLTAVRAVRLLSH